VHSQQHHYTPYSFVMVAQRIAAFVKVKIDPTLKTIASSGYSHDPIMADYKKYCFGVIVPKPYGIDELRKALYDVVRDQND
jgi:hypothetical protein